MDSGIKETVKSTQEQAVASWINNLNQIRLDELVAKLDQQDLNIEEALGELEELKQFIGDPAHILGNAASKHGEIAEHFQVNISNARNAVRGLEKEYTFDGVGRTAPEDYLQNGQQVQAKFYNGLGKTLFGKHGLKEHLETYPDFVKNGGRYDIPKDQYKQMADLLEMLDKESHKLNRQEYYLACKIKDYLNETGLDINKDIQPALAKYGEVQPSVAGDNVNAEEKAIKTEDKRLRTKAYVESKPTIEEGLRAVGMSAAIEGGVGFCMAVVKKRKEKSFSAFTESDWKEIGIDAGMASVKGGIRGGSIYLATNFTKTPANIASAYVTAAFGVAGQLRELKKGNVTSEDFVINCEAVCMDSAVSAIASLAGQTIIAIPVLGAVIGNVVGEYVYGLCKKYGEQQEQEIAEKYYNEIQELNKLLDVKLMVVVTDIIAKMHRFKDLEQMAFDEDVNVAFEKSGELALDTGVPQEKILTKRNEIDHYFMD